MCLSLQSAFQTLEVFLKVKYIRSGYSVTVTRQRGAATSGWDAYGSVKWVISRLKLDVVARASKR